MLKKNRPAIIAGYSRGPSEANLIPRMIEMGLVKGTRVLVVHRAPVTHDPIAVEVKGTVIGLDKRAASQIDVEELTL